MRRCEAEPVKKDGTHMDTTKVRITDKEGFKERYIKRIEDLGDYYGEYPIPPIEPISRINSIIHGTRMPTQEELDIIAETMECSVDWLLNGGEYPELDWDNAPSMKRSLGTFVKGPFLVYTNVL